MSYDLDEHRDTFSRSSHWEETQDQDTSSNNESPNCVVYLVQTARTKIVNWYHKHRFHSEDLHRMANENERSSGEFLLRVRYQYHNSRYAHEPSTSTTATRDRSEYISFTEIPWIPHPRPVVTSFGRQRTRTATAPNLHEPPPAYDEINGKLPEYYEAATPQRHSIMAPSAPPAYTRFVVQMSTESDDLEENAFAIL